MYEEDMVIDDLPLGIFVKAKLSSSRQLIKKQLLSYLFQCTLRLLKSSTTMSSSTLCTSQVHAEAPENDTTAEGLTALTLTGPAQITAPVRRLPHTALTFIHLSFLVGCFGLLMPHLPGVGDLVACRADGSVRVGEPQTQWAPSLSNLFCLPVCNKLHALQPAFG